MHRTFYVFSLLIIGSLLFISCSNIPHPLPETLTTSYQISDVNVVDVINETIIYHQDVQVTKGIITSITPHTQTLTGDDDSVTMIQGHGKYLIPGLWDNHSTLLKTSPLIDFPLYIANGVTSIRSNLSCPNEDKMSLYACMKDKAQWRKAIRDNQMLGPNIQGWGSFPITGKYKDHPDLPYFHSATTIEHAKQVVEHYASYPEEQRPFFLKTYNWIKPEVYSALSLYAKQKGFELSGHMQRSMNLTDVVDAGQRSIAHARLFLFDCSSISSELKAGAHKKTPLPELYRLLIDTFDEEGCKSRYQYLAEKHVYLNPTLMTRRNDYYVVAGKINEIQGLEHVHYLFMSEFAEDSAKLMKTLKGEGLTDEDIEAFKVFYLLTAHTIAQAQKAGVNMLAGTDSWSEYNVPGFSLHEELEALSEAGLNNYAALQAASINGAKYFNMSDQIGSIDIGKQADMVLLDADPIENIKHTKAIHIVFKGEQIYRIKKLTQLKDEVKELSKSHLLTTKILFMMLQNPKGF